MALQKHTKTNFQTLKKAADNGDLALMECTENATGKKVPVLCAVSRGPAGDFIFTPFAVMIDGNPYEMFTPPEASNGA